MIQLMKYFAILFMSIKISRERLKEFCEDHLIRLAANNPGGVFTTILTDATAAYTAYYGSLSSEAVKQAVQEGKTIAMNDAKSNLIILVRKDEKLFAFKYADALGTYEEFMPQGLTEYDNADLPTLVTIGLRLKNVIASHSADFDPGFVTEYNTIYQLFKDNRDAQKAAISNVDGERSSLIAFKFTLCKQMTINLLTIALQYVGNESKSDVYFDQAILNVAFKEAETKISNDINPAITQNIFDNITQPTVNLKIKNTGSESLKFGFESDDTTPVATNIITVPAGTTVLKNVAEIGFTTSRNFLNVTNASANMGSYSVEKV